MLNSELIRNSLVI